MDFKLPYSQDLHLPLSPAAVRNFPGRLRAEILTNSTYRTWAARAGARFHRRGVDLLARARAVVRFMNHHVTDSGSDWFVADLPALHAEIEAILVRQRRDYPHYAYFYGHPYQSLGILSVFGERATEERFHAYGLRELIGPEDRVLDVGCNCGFMALYTAFRTGCRVHGIDINPYMIEIGEACARYLRIDDRVGLEAKRIQDFEPDEPYTVVFSFATHWTDDENYRVQLDEHMRRLHGYLAPGGRLIFESHAADVDSDTFYDALEQQRELFEWDGSVRTDRGTRELFIMQRR